MSGLLGKGGKKGKRKKKKAGMGRAVGGREIKSKKKEKGERAWWVVLVG